MRCPSTGPLVVLTLAALLPVLACEGGEGPVAAGPMEQPTLELVRMDVGGSIALGGTSVGPAATLTWSSPGTRFRLDAAGQRLEAAGRGAALVTDGPAHVLAIAAAPGDALLALYGESPLTVATPGATIRVPVRLTHPPAGGRWAAHDIAVVWDPALLRYEEAETVAGRSSVAVEDSAGEGRLRLAAVGLSEVETTLAVLTFEVVGQPGTEALVWLEVQEALTTDYQSLAGRVVAAPALLTIR